MGDGVAPCRCELVALLWLAGHGWFGWDGGRMRIIIFVTSTPSGVLEGCLPSTTTGEGWVERGSFMGRGSKGKNIPTAKRNITTKIMVGL